MLEIFKDQLVHKVLQDQLEVLEQLDQQDLLALKEFFMWEQLHHLLQIREMFGLTLTTHETMFTTIHIGLSGQTLILAQQDLLDRKVQQVQHQP
jgi:hypothetical protein